MNLFAFDLRPEAVEFYLLRDGKEIYKEIHAGKTQSEILTEAIDIFLRENGMPLKDLDLIACNRGPGSFTALRIAMAVGKGLSEGSGVPMISVCGLDAYAAFSKSHSGFLLPVIDGRKKRFYAAFYRAGERYGGYADLPAEAIAAAAPTRWEETCPRAGASYRGFPVRRFPNGAGLPPKNTPAEKPIRRRRVLFTSAKAKPKKATADYRLFFSISLK